jgi:two-component system, NtrC family, sensor histidine kinase GlrK
VATERAAGLTRYTLRALIGGGFTVVIICLGLAVVFAAGSLQRLVDRSERLLSSGVDTTRLIERLAERITEVERAARQYTVVGSPDLLQIYRDREATLLQVMAALETRDVPALAPILQELHMLLQQVQPALDIPPALLDGPATFGAMNEVAQRARQVAQARFDGELARLQVDVARVRTALIALMLAVVAAAALGAAAFARLVSRPMAQITASIGDLGRAKLDTPIRVSGPRDLQAIGSSLDWLRRRIHDLEEEKSTFVRHMSHELKSPLANIRAGVDLLKDNGASAEGKQEITDIVERNVLRLQRHIDDLLRYAGWQDALPPQQPVPVDLLTLTEKAITDQTPEALARSVTVQADLIPLTLLGAEDQIRSIMDNLIDNAIKYSPEGGRVQVRLKKFESSAVFEVEDEGPGIPAHLHRRVFEPFFRGPGTAASRGTGIGLSLALAAAKAHGGMIEVLDKQGGAALRAVLPLGHGAQ